MSATVEKTVDNIVTYEAFGATGDGVTDDLTAICEAHAYANTHNLPVKSKPDATYHLGGRALTAIIATDTDWSTSRFTIDDTLDVEDHKAKLFEVQSRLEPVELRLDRLVRDQQQLALRPEVECHVLVENEQKRLYIRRGLNQNNGIAQTDCFILRRDGTIEGAIDWKYDTITRCEARPIDEALLVITGGIFTTFANRMEQPVGYNYWSRHIEISRSNTEIRDLTHYVVGETAVGHPYHGFIRAYKCANVTLRNCFFTGHKIYSTIGAAGKPVNMGSYDVHARQVVNFQMFDCRMNHICDRTRWGVISTDLCKNILLENCTLSRMDTHMGVSGSYTIRGCKLGHMGLNAIGRGTLRVEDSTLYGRAFVSFRGDYGSTWEGDLIIHSCRWIPVCGETHWPHLISTNNDGTHDFGYPCAMPHTVTIDGLFVDDSNHPAGYTGLYFFSDPDNTHAMAETGSLPAERPFPYATCEKLTVRGLSTASGKPPQISSNPELEQRVAIDLR